MAKAATNPDVTAVDLTAVVVAVTDEQPRVLVNRPSRGQHALPSGPLEPAHRTLNTGLRAWVERQTGTRLGYVEQLYTFGDSGRTEGDDRRHLSIGYLALTREAGATLPPQAAWIDWYRYFPWEDWRSGRPPLLDQLQKLIGRWVNAASTRELKAARRQRLGLAFGCDGAAWSDEHVLERYELLYEVGLVPEAHRDGAPVWAKPEDVPPGADAMVSDHRRILATAIARLRGKIKYRPVVFELMPPGFTLLQLQRAVEALSGMLLHKQNFRRLVEQQGLVEETGQIITATGGRPAREVRFRQDVVLERLAPGVRIPKTRERD